MFNFVIRANQLEKIKADVLAVAVVDLKTRPEIVPDDLWAKILERAKRDGFQPKWGAAKLWFGPDRHLALIGLGASRDAAQTAEAFRRGLGAISRQMRAQSMTSLAVVIDGAEAAVLAGAAVESLSLASYRFAGYSSKLKREQAQGQLRQVFIVVPKAARRQSQAAAARAQEIMAGVTLARELVNRPAAEIRPRTLAREAQAIARHHKNIKLKIFDRRQIAQLKMNAFLAVARGSDEPPMLIHLTYKPKQAAKKIFIVGKGITFDSGGLSLKPAEYMENMKCDMAGAAAVLGLFSVLPRLNIPVEVHGVIAAAENMPSGRAYRPGDILRAKNGKTIEVANTDAEGRLTLADALAYASDFKPDAIVDLATLTGACMVALGETVAGLFGSNDELLENLVAAAKNTGEAVARLPMPAEYQGIIESRVADLKNIGNNYAGAITAAMFLREFVDEKIPWAHLDIAGPSFAEKPRLPYWDFGGTGYGVRLLAEYLKGL